MSIIIITSQDAKATATKRIHHTPLWGLPSSNFLYALRCVPFLGHTIVNNKVENPRYSVKKKKVDLNNLLVERVKRARLVFLPSLCVHCFSCVMLEAVRAIIGNVLNPNSMSCHSLAIF